MGVLYTVWPLDSQMQEWLASQEIEFPDTPSRWPTKTEVRDVLNAIKDVEIKYTENGQHKIWDADVQAPGIPDLWTLLHADPDESDDQTRIHFEKGEPALIIAILRDLSSQTGPLVLIADTEDRPLVVSRSSSFRALIDEFCGLEEDSETWKFLALNAPGVMDAH